MSCQDFFSHPFSTCPSLTVQPIDDPSYALMRIISIVCHVIASPLNWLLPIDGQ
jgi:hypothetical protein